MFYKALGFVTWKVAKRYAKQRAPSGRSVLIGTVGIGVVALAALAAAKRNELFR